MRPLTLLMLVVLAACSGSTTPAGLEVIVESDLKPSEYTSIWIQVQQQTSSVPWKSLVHEPLAGGLPARFAIAAGSSADQDVQITVTAYQGSGGADGGPGVPVVVRTEQVQVPRTYVGELDIDLSSTHASCPGTWVAGTATTPAMCTINLNDAGPLPTYRAGTNAFDASSGDTTSAIDASMEASVQDATRDVGTMDARPDVTLRDAAPDVTTVDAGIDAHADAPVTPDAGIDGKGGDGGAVCLIGGVSYSLGPNPTNACQTCVPATSATSWTDVTDGTECETGAVCHTGICSAGCEVGGVYYITNAPNPANPCESCQPPTSTSAWSKVADGFNCGNGQMCTDGQCGSSCSINGASYTPGDVNTSNACQSCQPGTSAVAWSNLVNGTSCGAGEVCNTGVCGAACFIGGAFFAASAPNPSNACQSCQPGTNASGWTNIANGSSCGTGEVCSGPTCEAGCFIGGSVIAAGTNNPTNSCQSCKPGTSTTGWSSNADGASCATGEVCSSGSCVSGCTVGGTVYLATIANPNNACQTCQPPTSTTAWTTLANGASCGGGQQCNAGTCGENCTINGMTYGSSTANPSNACQSCQPATSATAWTNFADGTSCGTGEVCSAGACSASCFIGGMVYPSGVTNTANACETCQSSTSTTAWSNLPTGTGCGTGDVCNAGNCAAECFIGGVVYTSGAANPTNACQSCQPATSTTGWTNVVSGTSCGAGELCNSGTCASACDITGIFYGSSTLNPNNACQSCQPTTNTGAWSNLANGSSCGTGSQICNAGVCGSDCDIGGMIYTSGAVNTANECQSCQPAASTTGWTTLSSGTSCGTGKVCSGTTCESGCFIGSTVYASGSADPSNGCMSCQPSTSTTSWTNTAAGSACSPGGTCQSGTCSVSFGFTGGAQSYVVPAGVSSVTVVAYGGGSGSEPYGNPLGQAGATTATIAVTPAETLQINVGGQGGSGTCTSTAGAGGFNGGGTGGSGGCAGAGGGGASDVRRGGTGLANRVVIAGGAGGPGTGTGGGAGGAGGGTTGATGGTGGACGGTGGHGGTQSAGGSGGIADTGSSNCLGGVAATAGNSGQGGNGSAYFGPGGAGGGFYGGGGGSGDSGGGGGSSYAEPSATGVSMTQGGYGGAGKVLITY